MSFYDLNVLHPASKKLVSTLDYLGYGTLAINQNHHGAISPNAAIKNLVKDLSFPDSPRLKILSRVTLMLEDISVNYNLGNTTKDFDILAVRPTTEKTLQHACASMDVDIISLDLSQRLPYYLKHSTLGSATSRGVFLEICYSASTTDASARRLLLSNASNLVRVTRGRGIIISSEASAAMQVRGPYDLINLATFWGLNQDAGKQTLCENARKVIVKAHTRRNVHKGVIQITSQLESKTAKRPAPEGQVANQDAKATNGVAKRQKQSKGKGKTQVT